MEHSVLVMAFLGPWIRKQHENTLQGVFRWQGLKPFVKAAFHEVEVVEVTLVAFVEGFADTFANQIDAHALRVGMIFGESGQKMAVTAARFKCQALRGGVAVGKFCRQLPDTFLASLQIRWLTGLVRLAWAWLGHLSQNSVGVFGMR